MLWNICWTLSSTIVCAQIEVAKNFITLKTKWRVSKTTREHHTSLLFDIDIGTPLLIYLVSWQKRQRFCLIFLKIQHYFKNYCILDLFERIIVTNGFWFVGAIKRLFYAITKITWNVKIQFSTWLMVEKRRYYILRGGRLLSSLTMLFENVMCFG